MTPAVPSCRATRKMERMRQQNDAMSAPMSGGFSSRGRDRDRRGGRDDEFDYERRAAALVTVGSIG